MASRTTLLRELRSYIVKDVLKKDKPREYAEHVATQTILNSKSKIKRTKDLRKVVRAVRREQIAAMENRFRG